MDATTLASFNAHVHAEPNTGCFLWVGATDRNGYGSFNTGRPGTKLAHRIAWEHEHGPIPHGLELDHVRARGCSGPSCVNPAHLEPVTHRENVMRGASPLAAAGSSPTCRNGHPLVGDNVIARRGNAQGVRECRTCRLARRRRRYAEGHNA
jgi:hypothetical protein